MDQNMDNWYQTKLLQQSEDDKGIRYHVSSFILHVVSFASAIMLGSMVPAPVQRPMTEFTIVELNPEAGGMKPAEPIAAQLPTSKAQAEIAPIQAAKVVEEIKPQAKLVQQVEQQVERQIAKPVEQPKWDQEAEVKVKSPQLAETKMLAKPVMPQAPTHHANTQPNKANKLASRPLQGPTVKDSDFVAPILETEEFENNLKQDVHFKAQKFDDRTIQEDLDKVDEEQEVKVAALHNELDSETKKFINEQNEDLSALEADKDSTNQVLKSNSEKMKASDAAKIAAAQAQEKAAANEKAAAMALAKKQAEEARQARAAAAAQAAAAAEQQAQTMGNAKKGQGIGNGEELDGSAYGVEGPIHQLGDIRQMPGNSKPPYDIDDRFNGRKGEIALLAFVTNEGRIAEIKLIKSTGHRSLDTKTLKAIQTWKFYPGQEGWVEIPFTWDLKGQPQEMPTILRRKVSQN